MEKSNDRQSKVWATITRLATFLGLFASIAAVISVLIQARTDQRKLEIQVNTADQLTSLPSVDGLKGVFYFKDTSVVDLWKLKIKFINNGDITLIGEGQSSYLLYGNIPIQFPSGVVILDISKKSSDFYSIVQKSPNQLELTFSQWRPKEEFETILYVTSNVVLKSPPIPTIAGRPIIDGDIIVSGPSAQETTESQFLLDKLPSPVASMGRILGIILATIIFCFTFYFAVYLFPKEYFSLQIWKAKYGTVFFNYLNKLNLNSTEKNSLLNRPWRLKGVYLSINSDLAKKIREQPFNFKLPDAPNYESFWQILLSLLIGILVCGICTGIIAGLIIV